MQFFDAAARFLFAFFQFADMLDGCAVASLSQQKKFLAQISNRRGLLRGCFDLFFQLGIHAESHEPPGRIGLMLSVPLDAAAMPMTSLT
jgi:hypothetical protein